VDGRSWEENANTIVLTEAEAEEESEGKIEEEAAAAAAWAMNADGRTEEPKNEEKEEEEQEQEQEQGWDAKANVEEVDGKKGGSEADGCQEHVREEARGEEGIEDSGDDQESEAPQGISIDVPRSYASTTAYCASLGHKVNHTFDDEALNCVYAHCEHPRFGHVRCIRTTREVKAGEELLVCYGYDLLNTTGDGVPDWFAQEHKKHLK